MAEETRKDSELQEDKLADRQGEGANPENQGGNDNVNQEGSAEGAGQDSSNGGEETGNRGNSGGNNKGKRKPGSERPKVDVNTGLNVQGTHFVQNTGRATVEDELGKGSLELRGDALSNLEEPIGQFMITKAEPTNLDMGKDFEDHQKILASRLNDANSPHFHAEMTGAMHKINTHEEHIAIISLPCVDEALPEYMQSSSMNDSGVVTVDNASKAPTGGQYLGQTIRFKSGKISKIELIDITPEEITAYETDDKTLKSVDALGAYRAPREAQIMLDNMTNFENSRDKGIAHNPIYNAPATQRTLSTLADIARDTTHIIEGALICASEFLAGINQDRDLYGQDVSRKAKFTIDKVREVLDFNGDGKKMSSPADLINKPFLVDIFDKAVETLKNSNLLWCYPRTTVAIKKNLQDLLRWTKKSRDHRSVAERCTLAFTTAFAYSDVTTVSNGGSKEFTGIGGNVNLMYTSMQDGNAVPLAITHPVFDGINATMAAKKMQSQHPWNKKEEAIVPLTFDPDYPMFAFLVLRSIREILKFLQNVLVDMTSYVEEGGRLCSTMVRYPVESLIKFLEEAGYGKSHWHDSIKGLNVTQTDNGNMRMRYPDTALLLDESKKLCEYHPGLICPGTITDVDGERNYTGVLGAPCGQSKISLIRMLHDLDPVILVNTASWKTMAKADSNIESELGVKQKVRVAAVNLDDVTVGKWLKARHLIGVIYAIPSALFAYDATRVKLTDGTCAKYCVIPESIFNLKLTAQDFSASQDYATTGIQLSTHRIQFGVPIDRVKRARVVVTNVSGTDEYMTGCVANAYNLPGYKANEGLSSRVVKGTASSKDVTTNVTPAELVHFPLRLKDLDAAEIPYLSLDRWPYHAKFFRSYTNPFVRIMEDDTLGANDGARKLVPHQLMVNDVYYWIELSSDRRMQDAYEFMEANKNVIESSLYQLKINN